MKLRKIRSINRETPESVKVYVSLSMDILDRLNQLLQDKFQGNTLLLADKMNTTTFYINRFFTGVQNYDIEILSKFEEAFGEKIVVIKKEES